METNKLIFKGEVHNIKVKIDKKKSDVGVVFVFTNKTQATAVSQMFAEASDMLDVPCSVMVEPEFLTNNTLEIPSAHLASAKAEADVEGESGMIWEVGFKVDLDALPKIIRTYQMLLAKGGDCAVTLSESTTPRLGLGDSTRSAKARVAG